MADIKRYNLAQFVFNGTRIRADTFKTTQKFSTEKHTCTESHNPYYISIGAEEVSWEISEIDQAHRKFFKDAVKYQKQNPDNLPEIITYDYEETSGELVEDDIFKKCAIEEISKENANGKISIKGSATYIQSD